MDNLIPHYKTIYENEPYVQHHVIKRENKEERLTIQDTTKSSMNITLHIPKTTLNAILLEANTLVGAQLARLEYTKQNILMQASQSMLAQANQNQSSVLSLLQ